MSKNLSLLVVALTFAFAGSTMAADPSPKTGKEGKKADSAAKDRVKKDERKREEGKREWKWKWPSAEEVFQKIDANHDGKVTSDEFKTAYDKWQAEVHKRRMQGWRERREAYAHHHGCCCCCCHHHHDADHHDGEHKHHGEGEHHDSHHEEHHDGH